ncbi:hypothetical protein TK90_2625 (plasmid) [Thioalkalivibrio sp. K90mix]|uniref:hypothetical protein n=1 Tax=Thioalkalivibrio sp. (strain K90mix) TaxID=396595 RepID=UPI000195AB2B|nr:hypothetical protein [Thioalkalivibrio sp. K90mix]ADC73112.1 hypothetical protein TK90_2625 [Thioalkalivibrio sp. K90mix]
MKIFVLMAQRKCDYPRQYGPEALACMSEYEHDVNPSWLHEKRESYLKTDELESVCIIPLEVIRG